MGSLGLPHRHHRRTDSTNARVRELAMAGAPGGLVVTADEQGAGRGRRGHSWFAPPGGALLYSALLRPLGERPLLPLVVPLAVCAAAESLAPVSCRLKWPNDVWIEGRKLAGVLIESRFDRPGEAWAVIGVGLNLSIEQPEFPEEIRETATSLALEPGSGRRALAALNHELARWLAAPAPEVLAGYRERDALAGKPVSWAGGSGVATGIDDAGHLLVDSGGGQVALGAGEVHLSVGP
jgi:BirA family biotin operon repressor/biotin-[acetyl-CoA-carboxylase] ligase